MIKTGFSKTLDMKYRTRETKLGVRLQTEDNIIYSESEIEILQKNKIPLSPGIHSIKKIFDGEIVPGVTGGI